MPVIRDIVKNDEGQDVTILIEVDEKTDEQEVELTRFWGSPSSSVQKAHQQEVQGIFTRSKSG